MLERIKSRNISADQLGLLAEWLDTRPEVPEVSAKLKETRAGERKFEETVKDAEQAAGLALVY